MSLGELTARELSAAMPRREPMAVLDVREMGEFRRLHIAGATALPLGDLEARARRYVPDPRVRIVACGCDDGREALAAARLLWMGFTDVVMLAGGIDAWVAAGGATATGWGFEGKQLGERVGVAESVPHVTADELARECGRTDVVILDSRTAAEFRKGHLPGAAWLPPFASLLQAADLCAANRRVYINCAGRTRSILGARLLRRMGFDNVFAVENGTWGWIHSGRKLEKGEGRAMPVASARAHEVAQRHAAVLAQASGVELLSPAWARAIAASPANAYVVDIRDAAQFRDGHLPGAFHVEGGLLQFHAEERFAVRTLPVLVVGEHTADAVAAAALLRELGYTAGALEGGFEAAASSLPVERGDEAWLDSDAPAGPAARRVDWSEATRELQAGALLLDVRALGEFALGHVPGSVHVARGCLERDAHRLDAARLHIVAGNGRKAARAAEALALLGLHVAVLRPAVEELAAEGVGLVEGVEGSGASVDDAKEDVDPFRRRGTLRQSVAESHAYLEWESALAHGVAPPAAPAPHESTTIP